MTVVHDFRGRESEIVLLLLSLFTFSPSSTKDGALLHCVIFFLYWLSSRDGFFFLVVGWLCYRASLLTHAIRTRLRWVSVSPEDSFASSGKLNRLRPACRILILVRHQQLFLTAALL